MRNNLCNDPDLIRSIESMVHDAVLFFRNRGHNRDAAIGQTALALGMTERRVWSFYYEQPVAAAREEYMAVRLAFIKHLAFQSEDLAQRSEAARMRRRQMEMEFE